MTERLEISMLPYVFKLGLINLEKCYFKENTFKFCKTILKMYFSNYEKISNGEKSLNCAFF